jgi:hypothetical protein
MRVKKIRTTDGPAVPEGKDLSVTLEPRPGHTDQEVVSLLKKHGARQVAILAPGFVSAVADGATLKAAAAVAHVQLKARKTPH